MTRFGPDPEDRIVPCYAHEEPNPWCPVCRGNRSTMALLRERRAHRELTGIERTHLEAVRERITDEDTLPVVDWQGLLDNIERWCKGDVE